MSENIVKIGSDIYLLKDKIFHTWFANRKVHLYDAIYKNESVYVADFTELTNLKNLKCSKYRINMLKDFSSYFNKKEKVFGYFEQINETDTFMDVGCSLFIDDNEEGNSKFIFDDRISKYLVCFYITNPKSKKSKEMISKLKRHCELWNTTMEEEDFVENGLYKFRMYISNSFDGEFCLEYKDLVF